MVKGIIIFLATGCYVGYSPLAPGTTGTLAAIPIYFLISRISPLYYVVIVLGFTSIAIWASDGAEILLQSRDCRHAMFMVPPTLRNIALGFVLFRALDIIKPFPIRSLEERVRGGYGVVLDDIIAGIYANLIIHVLRFTMLKGG
jgi:phosphatidylglycerophosphatase A